MKKMCINKKKLFVFYSIFFSFLILIIPVNSIESNDGQIIQKSPANFEKLYQAAVEQGYVKVILRLLVPDIEKLTAESTKYSTVEPGLEHVWGGHQADEALRNAISFVSTEVLFNISETDFNLNHTYFSIPFMALDASPETLVILQNLPMVLDITEDIAMKLIMPVPDDDTSKGGLSSPENLDFPQLDNTVGIVGADVAWGWGYTGSGWYVAVLDTGIRKTHEFFTGKTIVEACFAQGETYGDSAGDCPGGTIAEYGAGTAVHYSSGYQGYDHGTHVSGIATGNYGSLYGVAKDANIMAVKVFSKFQTGCSGNPCVLSWNSDSAAGLDYVYSERSQYSIAAVNMSLGSGSYANYCDTDIRKAAIDNLRSAGIATVISTGNEAYCSAIGAPACISSAVAIGASTDGDQESSFNNWHATLQELFAPGTSINSSTGASDTSYGSWNGTSMAAPHVAGAWALIKQATSASVTDIQTALQSTGVPITSVCDGYTSPISRIQIDGAINSLAADVTVTAPNGGEHWEQGSTQNITWTSQLIINDFKIFLYKDGTKVGVIDDNIDPALGTYSWTVGNYTGGPASPGGGYTIKIKEMDKPTQDYSDGSFTIDSPPSLTVVSPNGGESWPQGSAQNITWDASGLVGNLKIVLFKDGAKQGTIATGINPALDGYLWTVGEHDGVAGSPAESIQATAPPGGGYTIKLKDEGGPTKDFSDAAFTITSASGSITVTAPNGGESWLSGSTQNITWTQSGLSGTVKISLFKDGARVGTIATGISVTGGTYSWTTGQYTGGTAPAGSGYTVKIKDEGGSTQDFSNAGFNITSPSSITVTSPNGGESWHSGSTHSITWTLSGVSGTLKISLFKDGARIGTIASGVSSSLDAYSWTVGQYTGGTAPAASGYTIKIKEEGESTQDFSDAAFTITPPASITVTAPNGGESWLSGSTQNITWTSSGLSGTVKITLFKDGARVGTIASGVSVTAGTYSWTTGQYTGGTAPAGSGYTIKIKEEGGSTQDFSDAGFTIGV